jgi:hypothetical protein
VRAALILVAAAHAGEPSPMAAAAEILAEIQRQSEPTMPAPALCWQQDGPEAVVLAVHVDGQPLAPVDGTRAPTVADALSLLPDGSEWAGAEVEGVRECPTAG